MKKQFPEELEPFRIVQGPLRSIRGFGFNGAFQIPYITRAVDITLMVIVSDKGGWDHVSASTPHRCPTYYELKFIKDLFFEREETVVQFFPRQSEFVNEHPFCLHLWKQQGAEWTLPPGFMV